MRECTVNWSQSDSFAKMKKRKGIEQSQFHEIQTCIQSATLQDRFDNLLTPGNSIHCPTLGAPPFFALSKAARRRVLPVSDTIADSNSSDMFFHCFVFDERPIAHSFTYSAALSLDLEF